MRLLRYVLAGVGSAFLVNAWLPADSGAQTADGAARPLETADSLGDAEAKAGRPLPEMKEIPADYIQSAIFVDREKGRVIQAWHNPRIPGAFIQLVDDPNLDGLLLASPAVVRGGSGERADHPPIQGRPFGVTDIYWTDSRSSYVLSVSRADAITDEKVDDMLLSIQ